ncbi:MAG: hypothetical protein HGB10_05655 [Coriobacteriia bacterium]|nr:hypothetical protein [Coriobacteriia bacterium]
MIASRDLFIVVSTVHTAATGFLYSPTRSVYTAEERLTQTLESVASVRERAPGAHVVVAENSELADVERSALAEAADRLLEYASDESAAALRDGNYKGASEVDVLLRTLADIGDLPFTRLFKLSGRYRLTDSFELDRFPTDRIGAYASGNGYTTVLYSIPAAMADFYAHRLQHALERALAGASIEDVLIPGIEEARIGSVVPLGVCGNVAVDGTFIEY